jgi:glycosyltransferase involved in cell wall biosynthesis
VAAERDDKTRVLFVIGTLSIGGSERQLVELATHLAPRFAPTVCCLNAVGPLRTELTRAGVPVIDLGFGAVPAGLGIARVRAVVRWMLGVVRFARLLGRLRPDVVHGVLPHAYVVGAVAAWLAGVPVVVAGRRSLANFKRGRPVYRLAEPVVNRWTDLVIANCHAVREDTLASERLDPGKVVVVHNGLEVTRYDAPVDPELRAALQVGPGSVVIVVANLIAYKGHTFFLKAWAEVCRAWPDAVALLVGDGPERAALEALARELGVAERVRFLGSRTDVPALLAISDLLVHPSTEEGFCNAILEAMAAGRPVVATDVGGNREAVVDGETGLLVPSRAARPLAAAIASMLERPDLAKRMGIAARQRVAAEFDRSVMVRRYEDVYDGLLSRQAEARSRVRHRRAR